MEAMKCDRCGGYYDKICGREFNKIRLCNDNESFFRSLDMCPDCMNALMSFIKDGKKNDESRIFP